MIKQQKKPCRASESKINHKYRWSDRQYTNWGYILHHEHQVFKQKLIVTISMTSI